MFDTHKFTGSVIGRKYQSRHPESTSEHKKTPDTATGEVMTYRGLVTPTVLGRRSLARLAVGLFRPSDQPILSGSPIRG